MVKEKNARKMSISEFAARFSSDTDDIKSNVMYDALYARYDNTVNLQRLELKMRID